MKTTKIFPILAIAATALLSSCSDDKDMDLTGQPVSPDSPGAYFPADNQYKFTFEGDDPRVVNVKVARTNTSGKATVPLVVTNDNNAVKIPAEVVFDDGEKEVELAIDCADIPLRVLCSFSLTIPDASANPYVKGNIRYDGSAYLAGVWQLLDDNVVWQITDGYYNKFADDAVGALYMMEGDEQPSYKLTNFLGTGYDITFNVGADDYDGYNEILALTNADYDYDYGGFYIYDEENQTYPVFHLPGCAYSLSSIFVYSQPYEGDLSSAISLKDGFGYTWGFAYDYDDDNKWYYVESQFSFTPVK